jgi:hypothetical protein
MFKKWWRRREEQRSAQERKDAEGIVDARREVEHGDRRDTDLSDIDKSPPVFHNTDWTGGGPL